MKNPRGSTQWIANMKPWNLLAQQVLLDGRNVVGRPQATKWYTVEQLEARGMVGVYERNPSAGSMAVAVFGIVALLMACAGLGALALRWLGA